MKRLARCLLAFAMAAPMSFALQAADPGARRDPTQPPAAYAPHAPHAAPADPLDGFRPHNILTVDGHRYLVWHGRRYAVGDTVQGARIERIEESEVWLRVDGGVRRIPMFAGVEKKREGTR